MKKTYFDVDDVCPSGNIRTAEVRTPQRSGSSTVTIPEFIKAQGEVESQAKIYDSELKQMADELQRKSDEYQKVWLHDA